MRTRKVIYGKNLFFILLAVLLQYRCSVETGGFETPLQEESITEFQMKFAGSSATRSMNETQEQTIRQIQVLVFDAVQHTLVAVRRSQIIIDDPSNKRIKTFQVMLPRGTFNLMLIANVPSIELDPGITKDEVLRSLVFQQTEKWNANSTNPALIPFWGESKDCTVQENTVISGIPMLRILSRIDISVVGSAQLEFELKTVSLYHWQTDMCLISEHYDEIKGVVTKATESGSGLISESEAMRYLEGDLTTPDEAIEAMIYVNETPNPGVSSFPEMPCLVVGGKVDGNDQMRYYRIDFKLTVKESATYYDLLRNHRYRIQITDIITNGSDSEEEAYRSVPVGLEWQTEIWEEGNMENIIIEGNQWLKVDPGKFLFPCNRHLSSGENVTSNVSQYTSYQFKVETNVSTGWAVKDNQITYISGGSNWLDLSHWSGGTSAVTVEMFVEKNTTGAARQASFKIASGDIVYAVMVTQTAEELASVRITEAAGSKLETISFDSKAGESQSFIFVVEWFPRDWDCDVTIEEIAGNDPLEIETGSIQEETLSGGRKVYELQLSPFEAAKVGETLANKFVFTVRDSSGELGVYNKGVN